MDSPAGAVQRPSQKMREPQRAPPGHAVLHNGQIRLWADIGTPPGIFFKKINIYYPFIHFFVIYCLKVEGTKAAVH